MLHVPGSVVTTPPAPGRPDQAHRPDQAGARSGTQIPLWQVNLLRVGYFVMGVGLVVFKWPLLFEQRTWGLAEGTVQAMLVAMSVLALMGLRHPVRMLPILLFEVGWKLTWLAVFALPLWRDGELEGAALEQVGTVLWVAIVLAVVPWRHVVRRYVTASGQPWLRRGR